MGQLNTSVVSSSNSVGGSVGGNSLGVYSGGYTCPCGTWVPSGTLHSCAGRSWPYQSTNYWTWVAPTNQPNVLAFKGSVKTIRDLPRRANVGDGFFVEKDGVLVVRQTGGWYHFDTVE